MARLTYASTTRKGPARRTKSRTYKRMPKERSENGCVHGVAALLLHGLEDVMLTYTSKHTHTHKKHTHTQPELLGIDVETAVSAIRTERPDLNVRVLDQDAMYTQDYVTERVRIFEDAESRTVARVPRIG